MIMLILEVSVVLWATIMLQVLIAFRRSALTLGGTGIHHIMAGVFWIISASILQGLFWDILPNLMGREEFRAMLGSIDPSTWPNMIFYVIMGVAGLRLMYGFWLMIPDEDRGTYNIFTAAFYPKKLRMVIREKQ